MKKGLLAILLIGVLLLATASMALANDPIDPLQVGTPLGSDVTMAAVTISVIGSVEPVDPSTIPCDDIADFEDVAGGPSGTNYDEILTSGELQFAERFMGQILSYDGDFDVLSGSPSSPLTLQTGDPNKNICVYDDAFIGSRSVAGIGQQGFPNFSAIGEGSVAVLFPSPQSQFKFDITGTNYGSATLNFFNAEGSFLGTIVITPAPPSQTYGFRHIGGAREIAGFSVHNTDLGGIGFDNICYTELCPVKNLITDSRDTQIDIGELFLFPNDCDGDGTVEICIKYETSDSWELVETHLYVDVSPPTKSSPGKFLYKHNDPPIYDTSDQYCIEDPGRTLYIAAHAEVRIQIGIDSITGLPIYDYETAWAQGTLCYPNIGPDILIRDTGPWGTYFTFNF